MFPPENKSHATVFTLAYVGLTYTRHLRCYPRNGGRGGRWHQQEVETHAYGKLLDIGACVLESMCNKLKTLSG